MKKSMTQFAILILLTMACGVGYNKLLHSTAPEKHLPWTGGEKIYAHHATQIQPAASTRPVVPAPSTPPTSPPAPTGAPQPAAPAAPAPGQAASECRMIDIKEALEELDAGTTFIDARRTRDYEQGHIPGAICICPYEQTTFFDKIGKLRQEAVTDAPIVVYCTNSNECESSKMVCTQLKVVEFSNILIYEGGFPEWQKEQPSKIVKGSEPGKWNP